MAKVKAMKSSRGVQSGYSIMCPECDMSHFIAVEMPLGNGAQWAFNNDLEKPTFKPSVRHRFGRNFDRMCHYFVKEGKIIFCGDCTHELAGETRELLDWSEEDS